MPQVLEKSMNPENKHLAALDGLRALSIVLVLYSHLSSANSIPKFMHATSFGLDGVLIFFVISGYLITSKLLAEKRKSGTILIPRFLLQRAFRLLPASYLMILVSVTLAYFGYLHIETGAIVHAFTYTMNFYRPSSDSLVHLWSLSVEEQFYLLWPFVVLFCSFRNSKIVCICVLFVCPLLRAWGWYLGGIDHNLLFTRFDMQADSLAVGCLLAMVEVKLPRWLFSTPVALGSLFMILAVGFLSSRIPSLIILEITSSALCAAVLIRCLTFKSLLISRCLSWKPLTWLGTVSYSLYLWQQMFTMAPPKLSWPIFSFPYNLPSALCCATLSYYLLEKPVRDWGRRWLQSSSRLSKVAITEPALVAGSHEVSSRLTG